MKKNSYLQMDLQLFADVLNATTSAGLSVENKTFYDKNLIDQASPKLVHAQFGQKRPIPKNGGKKIEFRRFASLPKALAPLTEGITPPGQSLEATMIEAELRQYGDYVKMTDVLELTAIDNVIVEATNLCGRQGGQTMDTYIREVLHGGTNAFYAPKLAADGTETEVESRKDMDLTSRLTCDLIDQVVAFLKARNAPTFDGYYIGIIHPYAAYDLRKDERWRKPHEYCDPEKLYKGEIGEYGGVRFVDTSEAKIYKDDSCPDGLAVFSTLIFGQDAYGVTDIEGGNMEVIIKQKGSAGTSDPLDQRSTVGWKAMQAAEILVEDYLVRIESCSDKYSARVEVAN